MTEQTAAEQRTELMSSDGIARTVARIAHQIIEKTALDSPGRDSADSSESANHDKHGQHRVCLLGIPSGGAPLAQQIGAKIREFTDIEVPIGTLDVTLYRDDLRRRTHRALMPTSIPAGGIDDRIVILVDDVLYSGRTIRAALDALRDIGRPAAVQLAVLVDRGHRQLPIRADYVGKNVPTSHTEDVSVYLEQIDGSNGVFITR